MPFNPTADPARRLEQMASLATALTATGTDFSNELTYVRGMAPRSANCASLEHGGMQVNWKNSTSFSREKSEVIGSYQSWLNIILA